MAATEPMLGLARQIWGSCGNDDCNLDMCLLSRKVIALHAAIAKHRDQKGDDRCHLDDAELYAAIGGPPADQTLPPRLEFLANCDRYWECRKSGVGYESPDMQVRKQQTRIEGLERELKAIRKKAYKAVNFKGTTCHDDPEISELREYLEETKEAEPDAAKTL